MTEDMQHAFDALSEETKAVLTEYVERIVKVLRDAAVTVAKAIIEAFHDFIESIRPIMPGLVRRMEARAKAAQLEWRARGPRRNIALMRAILARRTV